MQFISGEKIKSWKAPRKTINSIWIDDDREFAQLKENIGQKRRDNLYLHQLVYDMTHESELRW